MRRLDEVKKSRIQKLSRIPRMNAISSLERSTKMTTKRQIGSGIQWMLELVIVGKGNERRQRRKRQRRTEPKIQSYRLSLPI